MMLGILDLVFMAVKLLDKRYETFDDWPIDPIEKRRGPNVSKAQEGLAGSIGSADENAISGVTQDQETYWFCYFPDFVTRMAEERFSYALPKNGNVFVYSLPPYPISTEPRETYDLFKRIAENSQEKIEDLSLHPRQINYLGVSMGNAVSFYLMGNGCGMNRLVSVTPGADLPWCIENSMASRKTARMGRKMGRSYDILDEFSPINHVGSIKGESSVEVWLGGRDLIVPSRNGKKLVERLETEIDPKNLSIHEIPFLGHISTIAKFGKLWQI